MEHIKKPLEHQAHKFFGAANTIVFQENETVTNLVIAPFAGSIVSAMLFSAASGETAETMESFLCFKQLFDGNGIRKNILIALREALRASTKVSQTDALECELALANRIFIQAGATDDIKQGFLEEVKKYLSIDHVELASKDPDAGVQAMKDWMKEHAGRINFGELPPVAINPAYHGHRLVTLSLSYFRGGWQVPFDRLLTSPQLFYPDKGGPQAVDMMTIVNKFPYSCDHKTGMKYAEIPYWNNRASLILAMPSKPQPMTEFVAGLTDKTMIDLRYKKKITTVRITLPKFRIQSSYQLEKLFEKWGFIKEDGVAPTLAHLTINPEFRAAEGLLSAAIQIDEDGTFTEGDHHVAVRREQAPPDPQTIPATTQRLLAAERAPGAVQKKTTVAGQEGGEEAFRAESPFLFAIRHNGSSAVLFSGVYLTPC